MAIRELDHIDLLVLCCSDGDRHECMNLMSWWLNHKGAYRACINHPSMNWWINRNAKWIAGLANKPDGEWREISGIRRPHDRG
jgi:hypothetical protein